MRRPSPVPTLLAFAALLLLPASVIAAPGPDEIEALDRLATGAKAELEGNILPFWMQRACDSKNGGFHAELRADGSVNDKAERGGLLTTRILWTYSAALRREPRQEFREMARRAFEDLDRCFWDIRHGGVYWSARIDGTPEATHKQTYLQAFAIYGLTEYYRATEDFEALTRAKKIFRLLEEHARDPENGGYLEAFTREWTKELPKMRRLIGSGAAKSQNTHLHLMEAYTNLLRVWPDDQLRAALTDIVGLMLDRIFDPSTNHLRLFFDEKWEPESQDISYGHDIEAVWLLGEAASVLGDEALIARVRPVSVALARATLTEGVSPLGGIYNLGGPKGVSDKDHEWWPQAEAVVGFLHAYEISGDAQFLRAAGSTWGFIQQHVVDREGGEWFLMVDPQGRPRPNRAKLSLWKCPYHNGRACMEIIDRAAALKAR